MIFLYNTSHDVPYNIVCQDVTWCNKIIYGAAWYIVLWHVVSWYMSNHVTTCCNVMYVISCNLMVQDTTWSMVRRVMVWYNVIDVPACYTFQRVHCGATLYVVYRFELSHGLGWHIVYCVTLWYIVTYSTREMWCIMPQNDTVMLHLVRHLECPFNKHIRPDTNIS